MSLRDYAVARDNFCLDPFLHINTIERTAMKKTVARVGTRLRPVVVPRFVYRGTHGNNTHVFEIGECDNPRSFPAEWCDRRVCEGFWGDEALCLQTVDAMNRPNAALTGGEAVPSNGVVGTSGGNLCHQ